MQIRKFCHATVLVHGLMGVLGGLAYAGIELLWRGHTHWTMGVLGGICFVLIGLINEVLPQDTPMLQQMLCGAALVTAAELIAGLALNRWLGLDIWDYSGLPLNLWGQVCAEYSALWFLLSGAAAVAEDWLHHIICGQAMPDYRLL